MNRLKTILNQALYHNCCENLHKFHEACYETLREEIYSTARHYCKTNAEDLRQDIFLKIFKMDINKFKPHVGYIESYLLKIARNHCLDYLKKKKITEDIAEYQLRDNGYNLNLSSKIDLENALESIPEKQAVAIRKQLEGHKIKEIAVFLDLTEGAVKNLIYYGKKNIRKYFKDQ